MSFMMTQSQEMYTTDKHLASMHDIAHVRHPFWPPTYIQI